jgi:ribosomal protein S6E (S10)
MTMNRAAMLSESIAEILDGENLGDVVPSLVMLLHHAAKSSGMPMREVVDFVERILMFENDEVPTIKH